jgi:hypothetical protein
MSESFDVEIHNLLETAFQSALIIGGNTYTPEQIKLMIVATNLESLAKTFLFADDKPEEITLNLKQVALGLLGTSDWVKEGLGDVQGM